MKRLPRRRMILVTLAACVCFVGWWMYDQSCRMEIFSNCQSDSLSTIAYHLREYAESHEGRLPPAAELLTVAKGQRDSPLWCLRGGLPYQWNLRLAGARTDGAVRRAVAWCPPGRHGRYVGVILVGDGEPRASVLTISELQELLKNDGD